MLERGRGVGRGKDGTLVIIVLALIAIVAAIAGVELSSLIPLSPGTMSRRARERACCDGFYPFVYMNQTPPD